MRLRKSIQRFVASKRGHFAVIAALCAPLFFVGLAGSVDVVSYRNHASALQNAADGAALAAVREAGMQGWSQNIAENVADSFIKSNIGNGISDVSLYKIDTTVDEKQRSVTVVVHQDHYPYFSERLLPSPQIAVSATAMAAGRTNVCVIGLMQPQRFAKASIHLDNRARINATNCSVYSNSEDRFGLRVDSSATLTAQMICSAGGLFKLFKATLLPEPITDCPKIEDPLKDRPLPKASGCDFAGVNVKKDETLSPGVYCGGLTISNGASARLKPGTYVIKDGPLIVADGATFKGAKISLFMTGSNSLIDFRADSTISISAPESGPLAGILISEDRNVPYSFDFNPFLLSKLPPDVRLHKISSNDARNLLGTIYLSRSILLIDANAPVADASAYTAIVVARLWLQQGPILTLNTRYSATRVPVPAGIGPTEIEPHLVE